MIRKWIEFRRIRHTLKKALMACEGSKKHYSLETVLRCCEEVGVRQRYRLYAVAAYASASSYYSYLSRIGLERGEYKYKGVRWELGLGGDDRDVDGINPGGMIGM